MNHSLKVGPTIEETPCDRSPIAALENRWTNLLIDEARDWPGEKRPGWIPMAAVYMVLEQVYKDGISVGARSWQDDPEEDQTLEHFSYGGTSNE